MITEADDNTNLGELKRRTEQLEDVIGAVQMMVNQLNQFLIQATEQGIQLLPNFAGPPQQALAFILGETKGRRRKLTSLKSSLQDCGHIHGKGRAPHQRVKEISAEPVTHEGTYLFLLELTIGATSCKVRPGQERHLVLTQRGASREFIERTDASTCSSLACDERA